MLDPVREHRPPRAADLVVVRVVHQQHVVARPRGRSQVPQVRERRGVVVVPVHEDQVAELGRLRRIEGGREGRERFLRVAEHNLDAARVKGRVEEARDVRRVPVDPKVEGPHADPRVLHEPQKRRVARVEADLADLDSFGSGAVPQDVAEEVPHRVELERDKLYVPPSKSATHVSPAGHSKRSCKYSSSSIRIWPKPAGTALWAPRRRMISAAASASQSAVAWRYGTTAHDRLAAAAADSPRRAVIFVSRFSGTRSNETSGRSAGQALANIGSISSKPTRAKKAGDRRRCFAANKTSTIASTASFRCRTSSRPPATVTSTRPAAFRKARACCRCTAPSASASKQSFTRAPFARMSASSLLGEACISGQKSAWQSSAAAPVSSSMEVQPPMLPRAALFARTQQRNGGGVEGCLLLCATLPPTDFGAAWLCHCQISHGAEP